MFLFSLYNDERSVGMIMHPEGFQIGISPESEGMGSCVGD